MRSDVTFSKFLPHGIDSSKKRSEQKKNHNYKLIPVSISFGHRRQNLDEMEVK